MKEKAIMKKKASNAGKSFEVTDVTALSATVNEADMHLYVSQNSECISNCFPVLQI